jgi:hypothetical protein
MDLPSVPHTDVDGCEAIVAPWGRTWFSQTHGCFVQVLPEPVTIGLDVPGPRRLSSSSSGHAIIEDCVGVTAATLLATVGVDRLDEAVRRFILVEATTPRRAFVSSGFVVPRTDQIWLGFDGRVVVTVPCRRRSQDDDVGIHAIGHDLDVDISILSLAFDVSATGEADHRQGAALAAMLAVHFPAEVRAWHDTLAFQRAASRPRTAQQQREPMTRDESREFKELALYQLEWLAAGIVTPPLSREPGSLVSLPLVTDGNDDDAF